MKKPQQLPVAHATRILLAEQHISDIDTALAFIGVQRTAPTNIVAEEASTEELETTETAVDEALMAALAPEIIEEEVPSEDTGKRADQKEARLAREILKSEWFDNKHDANKHDTPQVGGSGSASGARLLSDVERSMVSYLLPMDKQNHQDKTEQPKYDYTTIDNRVQHVLIPSTTPDAEAWRVARKIMDNGPRTDILAGLDLRECANKIARAEAIERLPRARKQIKRLESVQLLVERDLARRVHSVDIKKLLKAMQAIGIPNVKQIKKIQQRDSLWYWGTGPLWTYQPFFVSDHPTWYILFAGGKAANKYNLAEWKKLLGTMQKQHTVTVVWLGDHLPSKSPSVGRSWVSYRN